MSATANNKFLSLTGLTQLWNNIKNLVRTTSHNVSIEEASSNMVAAAAGHNHTVLVTPSVSSTFTGTSVTSGTPSNNVKVSSNTHTHTLTPKGNVVFDLDENGCLSVSFTGVSVTTGTHATSQEVNVASSSHNHSVVAAGNIGSTASATAICGSASSIVNVVGKHTHDVIHISHELGGVAEDYNIDYNSDYLSEE